MPPPPIDRFDDLFLAVAQDVGKIEDLLDIFFSFLSRKTDYFHIMTKPNDTVGFPPHKAFEMLQSCFHKHQILYLTHAQPYLLLAEHKSLICPAVSTQQKTTGHKQLTSTTNKSTTNKLMQPNSQQVRRKSCDAFPSAPPDFAMLDKVEIELDSRISVNSSLTPEMIGRSDLPLLTHQDSPLLSPIHAPTSNDVNRRRNHKRPQANNEASILNTTEGIPANDSITETPDDDLETINFTRNSYNLPVKYESKDNFYKRISTWNGGMCDTYWWAQTLTEATVDLILPSESAPIIKSDLKVELTTTRLKVEYKGAVVVDGEFYEPIHLEGSIWVVEDQARLLITLDKARENWWGNIFKGQKEIDLSKVESVKKIQEYDEETQSAIRKVMWDEERRSQGLKTSEQMETEELLKKAWDAEGSPFKGQSFDPSHFNTQGGGCSTLPRDILDQLKASSAPK